MLINLTLNSASFLLVLVLLCLRMCFGTSSEKTSRFYEHDVNGYSLGRTSHSVGGVRSNVMCAALCGKDDACLSYLYVASKQLCQLGCAVVHLVDPSLSANGAKLYGPRTAHTASFEETCSSNGYAYAECSTTTCPASISLVKQLSKSVCQKDVSFGLTDAGVVWVNQGCRGTFLIDYT